MIDIFRDEQPIRKRLERIFAVALDIYLSGDAGPRGCFTVMTAASEAVSDPGYPRHGAGGIFRARQGVRGLLPLRQGERRTARIRDPLVLAQLASATIHSIAIRARVPRKELEAIVKGAIDVMCGAQSSA